MDLSELVSKYKRLVSIPPRPMSFSENSAAPFTQSQERHWITTQLSKLQLKLQLVELYFI